jgi:hypothetical protein
MEEQTGRVPKKSLTSTSEIKASKSNVVQQVKFGETMVFVCVKKNEYEFLA